MEIIKTSPLTGKRHTMQLDITIEQYNLWQSGELIQVSFPNLSKGEREFLKSGITPEEWDNEFGEL